MFRLCSSFSSTLTKQVDVAKVKSFAVYISYLKMDIVMVVICMTSIETSVEPCRLWFIPVI